MNTGQPATRSQQLLLAALLVKRSFIETIVIHHVTEDCYKLQLEVERRCPLNGIAFERIVL